MNQVPITHIIDCSKQPMIPEGWSIRPKDQIASRFQRPLTWNPAKIRLHLDPRQSGKGCIKGEDLQEKLAGVPVLRANVLDFLEAHKALIPPEWKGMRIFFWGDSYYLMDGSPYVRALFWWREDWKSNFYRIDRYWFAEDPAAVLEV